MTTKGNPIIPNLVSRRFQIKVEISRNLRITRYKGEVMGIHSKILIHWTGKDIENCPDPNKKSQLYVERLKDDLEKGLFAKTTEEDVIRGWKIKNVTRLCFTELD